MCQALMYADDALVYTASQSITEIERVLTNEMESISYWIDNNRLVINLKKGKTETILFRIAKHCFNGRKMSLFLEVSELMLQVHTST